MVDNEDQSLNEFFETLDSWTHSKVKKDAAALKMMTFLKQAGRTNGVVIDEDALETPGVMP